MKILQILKYRNIKGELLVLYFKHSKNLIKNKNEIYYMIFV